MKMEVKDPKFAAARASRQKEIFETIHEGYYESGHDPVASAYRDRYINNHVLAYLGDCRSVIELACGKGAMVGWLKQHRPSLRIAGCDISERAAEDFRALHDGPCYVADLTKPFKVEETYDAVVIMGGIHHLVADLDAAFANIRALLNPGGRLIMAEPNSDYFLEPIRKIWYRLDQQNFDADSEHALSHGKLFGAHGFDYEVQGTSYFGGVGYHLLMLNYFLRIPNRIKQKMAPLLMWIERGYHRLPGKYPYASFIACWQLRKHGH